MKRTPLKRSQKPLKRTAIGKKYKPKSPEQKEAKLKMNQMFLEIWDERQDKNGNCFCFETGARMNRDYYRELSCYDHVLEKENYPEYKLLKKNIVILLPSVHSQKGTNIELTPKVKEYRTQLLELHKKGEL
jgi:hypothetical protein